MPELSPFIQVPATIPLALSLLTAALVAARGRRLRRGAAARRQDDALATLAVDRLKATIQAPAAACVTDEPVAPAAELLDRAQRAARIGDRFGAHQFLLASLELDPRCEDAWLWLAAITDNPDESLRCLETVLSLNPDNPVAQRGLQAAHPASAPISA